MAKIASPPNRPALRGPAELEVLILGGGMAGLCAAWFLCELGVAPRRVGLLEAGRIGAGASGRSAGILAPFLPEPYLRLRAALGDKARRLVELSRGWRHGLPEIARECDLEWDHEQAGALFLAASAHEERELQQSAAALRADGFPVATLDAAAAAGRLGAPAPSGSSWP